MKLLILAVILLTGILFFFVCIPRKGTIKKYPIGSKVILKDSWKYITEKKPYPTVWEIEDRGINTGYKLVSGGRGTRVCLNMGGYLWDSDLELAPLHQSSNRRAM